MRNIPLPLDRRFAPQTVALALLLPIFQVMAADPVGLYVGAAISQSRVEANGQHIDAGSLVYTDTGSFKENDSAFKLMVGIRPTSLLGAELAYNDFGHPSGSFNVLGPANVSMTGESAFGLLYLPVPLIDFFLKAGVARIQSTLNGTGTFKPNCLDGHLCPLQSVEFIGIEPFQLDRTNTSFAAGAGLQYKLGSWAVRAEYERFNAAGGNPSLASLGFTWMFL